MDHGFRIPLAVLACCSLLAAGGCTRTSDGSVVMKNPPSLNLSVPSFMRFGTAREEPRPVATAAAFPPPPAPPPAARTTQRRVVPPVKAWKASGVRAPFKRSDPSKPLTCRNEPGQGGRVKVVCQ